METRSAGYRSWLGAAAVVGLALVLSALIFGLFFYNSRTPERTIQVVGSASQRFTSDVVKWRLQISRRVGEGELQYGYGEIHQDVEHLVAALRSAGVSDTSISVQPVNAQQNWGANGPSGYNLVQSAYVVSGDPQMIEDLAVNPGELMRPGAALEGSNLEYYYTGVTDLKHSLLGAAMRDARSRAEEIAGADDSEVGGVQSARAGVFQITEPYSTEVSGMGMYSTGTRDKEISVTVHATFGMD